MIARKFWCFTSPNDEEPVVSPSIESSPKLLSVHSVYIIDDKLRGNEKILHEKSIPIRNNNEEKKEINTGTINKKTGWRRYIGIFLILLATMTYSLGTLFIKILQDLGYHVYSINYIRFQGLLIPGMSVLLHYWCSANKPIFEPVSPITQPTKFKTAFLLTIRSILGCTSTIFHIYALRYISLADASVIAFSCPVFVVVLTHLLGMEKMGYASFFITLSTLAGVGIICRPPILTGSAEFDMNMLIGSGLAFGSMICTSSVIILLRSLRCIHFSLLMTSYAFFGSLECAIFALISRVFTVPETIDHWLLCAGLIGFTFIAQIALIASLKYEEAGPVALIQTTDSIFSFIWQYLAFSVIPDIYSVSGAFIVIFGVCTISFKKIIAHLPPENPTRRRFQFLLK